MTSGDTTGRKVFLHSAERPDETQEKRLNAFLCKRYGEGAELVWVEDHTLENGFRLESGDDVYDWSPQGRLEQLAGRIESGGRIRTECDPASAGHAGKLDA